MNCFGVGSGRYIDRAAGGDTIDTALDRRKGIVPNTRCRSRAVRIGPVRAGKARINVDDRGLIKQPIDIIAAVDRVGRRNGVDAGRVAVPGIYVIDRLRCRCDQFPLGRRCRGREPDA